MKTLIAYASKTGTTEKCAKILAEKLVKAEAIDLCENDISPEQYDVIILGGSVRMGMLHKTARQWLSKNWEMIQKKKYACFFCNAFVEQEKQVIEGNFSENFIKGAFYLHSFGGEIKMDNLRGFEKIMVRTLLKSDKEKKMATLHILDDRIQDLANEVLGL